jgi:hypothetical protein
VRGTAASAHGRSVAERLDEGLGSPATSASAQAFVHKNWSSLVVAGEIVPSSAFAGLRS